MICCPYFSHLCMILKFSNCNRIPRSNYFNMCPGAGWCAWKCGTHSGSDTPYISRQLLQQMFYRKDVFSTLPKKELPQLGNRFHYLAQSCCVAVYNTRFKIIPWTTKIRLILTIYEPDHDVVKECQSFLERKRVLRYDMCRETFSDFSEKRDFTTRGVICHIHSSCDTPSLHSKIQARVDGQQ